MRKFGLKTIQKVLVLVALTAFISITTFGALHSFDMGMNSKGEMSPCPFLGVTAICKMNPLEHITTWQKMFTTTPPQKVLAFALLLLLAVVFVAVRIFKRNLLLLSSHHANHLRLYIRHNSELSLFNPLREAFSQGILNPKTF